MIDRRISELAAEQHRAVATGQLLVAGLTKRAIHSRVERGWLVRAHRGVYWAGGPGGIRSHEIAAVLALGRGAFLSHLSAAYFHGLLPYPDAFRSFDSALAAQVAEPRAAAGGRPGIDVSVANRKPARRDGIVAHRASRLESGDVRIVDAIAVSTPARTLVEIAATASQPLEQAYDEAVYAPRSFRPDEIEALLERFTGMPGVPALRALHRAESSNDRSRLEGEQRLRALISSAGLPRPKVNARLGPYRIDLLWPAEKVAIEMDGFAEHGKRRSFESDRARDADLSSRGYRIVRVTWRQLTKRPYEVIARIAAVLARAATARADARGPARSAAPGLLDAEGR